MQSADQNQPITPSVPETRAPAPSPAHSLRNEIRVWTRDLLIAIGLALVIIVFLYQPVKVEGTSMAPLLSDQERIFINKFVYRFEPIQRRDVVVFWYPLDRKSTRLNSSHPSISYAVFCLKKKKYETRIHIISSSYHTLL